MEKITLKVGNLIRTLRKQRGITQEELADLTSLHKNHISALERGEKNATIESLHKITDALNISLGEFFQQIDPISTNRSNTLLKINDLLLERNEKDRIFIMKHIEELLGWKDAGKK